MRCLFLITAAFFCESVLYNILEKKHIKFSFLVCFSLQAFYYIDILTGTSFWNTLKITCMN